MLVEERKEWILRLLEETGRVKNKTILEHLGTSESSVRRDLLELEEAGLLKRVHGGAVLPTKMSIELNVKEKTFKNVQETKQIAKFAVSLIQEGDVIYLDAGTTTGEMIPYFQNANKKMTVVTNSVNHAAKLDAPLIEVLVIGGKIKKATEAIVGSFALKQLQSFHFDRAFLGMNGIDPDLGYTTPDIEEAVLKEMAMKQSEHSYVLADESKFGLKAFVSVAPLKMATILTCSEDVNNLEAYKNKTKMYLGEEAIR
ncbi:MAG: DeoR/GlpR family DNA-binding transcription regulator [Turicibacter sp.]|nr:DeoR/GlpR family DNA-binding transcription regulator [Turicibacter sp.]